MQRAEKNDTIGSELGNHFILLGYLFIGDLSWHELRDEVGFPYTMEERIKDSYYYEPQGTKTVLMVYTSKQDPNATAIDLIDAVYGEVYTIKQDTKSPERWIVIYTTKDVSVISVVNGTTYVEVGQLKTCQIRRIHE